MRPGTDVDAIADLVRKIREHSHPSQAQATTQQTMATIKCPNCFKHALTVTGSQGKCPGCNTEFTFFPPHTVRFKEVPEPVEGHEQLPHGNEHWNEPVVDLTTPEVRKRSYEAAILEMYSVFVSKYPQDKEMLQSIFNVTTQRRGTTCNNTQEQGC